MHSTEGYVIIASTAIVFTVIFYLVYALIRLNNHYGRVRELQNQAKLAAVEIERKEVAADLHDDIGAVISSTRLTLGTMVIDTEREQLILAQVMTHLEGVLGRVRSMSNMLVPASLSYDGPLHAIDEFVATYGAHYDLNVRIFPIDTPGLSPENALNIYRMLQEILNNTLKHARAYTLTISGTIENDLLIIETEDDGVGYNSNDLMRFNGFGLLNLRLRASKMNAQLLVDTAPSKGTKYTIQIKLNNQTNTYGCPN